MALSTMILKKFMSSSSSFLFLLIFFLTPSSSPLTITPVVHHLDTQIEQGRSSSSLFSSRAGLFSLPKTNLENHSGYTLPLFKIPEGKRRPEPPHYVKYWTQNKHHAPHAHAHKKGKKSRRRQGWKMTKAESYFSPGYLVDLTERVLDGIGILPEFGGVKNKNEGWGKHGKYVFKGITMHHGLYTSVL